MITLAIDPGNRESAFVLIDPDYRPNVFGKLPNDELLDLIYGDGWRPDTVCIEMVASYGMAVGADVFETCVWIGRFTEALHRQGSDVSLIKRNPVKVHICGSSKAKDGNIAQALRDRFGDKGTKAEPGWFYGFAGDIWQAYALGVYAIDTDQQQETA